MLLKVEEHFTKEEIEEAIATIKHKIQDERMIFCERRTDLYYLHVTLDIRI